jgi:hypothetical protein
MKTIRNYFYMLNLIKYKINLTYILTIPNMYYSNSKNLYLYLKKFKIPTTTFYGPKNVSNVSSLIISNNANPKANLTSN